MATYGLSWPAQGTDQDQVWDLVITSFRPTEDSFAWHHMTCLGLPKELITPREGPRHQSLRANRDVFASQYVNSHGPPKHTTEATSKTYFSLAN
jgi:hypothetical protein